MSKGAVGNATGSIKMPIKKSITGGLNKLHRDSMGDTGTAANDTSGNQQPVNGMLNFYEKPTRDRQDANSREREREMALAQQNQNLNTYEAPANLMNRLSPKMPLESASFHKADFQPFPQHNHQQAFHNLNNKLKKKNQGRRGPSQPDNSNVNINMNVNVNMNMNMNARDMKDVSE